MKRKGGDAYRDRDQSQRLPLMPHVQLTQLRRYTLRPSVRVVQLGSGQDDDELFSAETAHNILRADAPAEEGRELAQDRVARIVAVGVVKLLEVVEIEHEDAERLLGPHGAADFSIQRLFEIAAVVESGERVLDGLSAQRFTQPDVSDGQSYLSRESRFEGKLRVGHGGGFVCRLKMQNAE